MESTTEATFEPGTCQVCDEEKLSVARLVHPDVGTVVRICGFCIGVAISASHSDVERGTQP